MFEKFGKSRFEVVKSLIWSCNPRQKVILDVGAGLTSVSDGIECLKRIKIDINSDSKPDIVCDVTQGIPIEDNAVDICVACEVIEHIYDSKQILKEVVRVLRPGGNIIVTCPNVCSLKYRLAFMIGKIPAHAAKGDHTYEKSIPGHIRDYNFGDLEKILRESHFDMLVRKSDGMSFGGRTIFPGLMVPCTLGDSVILKATIYK